MTQAPSFPETLRALKQASDEAHEAYMAHKRGPGLSVDESITFDLAERRLCKAQLAARAAYDQALEEYQAGAGGLK